jgi:hypothetical protein
MVIILSIVVIIMGLGCIFAKDFMWELQDHSNRARGIVNSQRTPEWESGMTFIGALAILVGTVVFLGYI